MTKLLTRPIRALSVLATAMLFGVHPAAQGQPPVILPAPTTIAVPVPVSEAGGGFENSAINPYAYNPIGWPWAFSTQSGIVKIGADPFVLAPPAPEGVRTGFIQGTGTITKSVTLNPGIWRMRFSASQRVQGGVPDQQSLRVTIQGVTAFEQSLSGAFDEYFTDIVRVTTTGAYVVQFVGTGAAAQVALIDNVRVDKVLFWDDASSWSAAAVPVSTDYVWIPKEAAVALRSTCSAKGVIVSGDLTVDYSNCSLTSQWVAVLGAGSSFTVGTEQQPFLQDFQLTLNATDPNVNLANAGNNFLMSMDGGVIDMHGKPKTSWTKLTAMVGSVLTVLDVDGWKPGDNIVMAFTGFMGESAAATPGPKSEVRTITVVDSVAKKVTLSQAPTYANYCVAAPVTYSHGTQTWSVDQRTEVGMLSHNVRIVGVTSDTAGFGAHVMVMACCPYMPPGFGRFSNVELTRVGQKGRLGRYPMHWHMQRENGAGQYINDCSIHDSFNRAITIHGSHNVFVERNVCFDVVGHAVFFEDGVERHNHIEHNLVIGVCKPTPCEQVLFHDVSFDQPQNRSPASFWISNPDNTFLDNVAADSAGTGYWFALHRFATGASAKPEWIGSFDGNAVAANLGQFDGNVCHSCRMAIDVQDSIEDSVAFPPCQFPDPQMETLINPADDDIFPNFLWSPQSVATLRGFVASGCTTGIYTGSTDFSEKLVFDDCVLVDNGVHVQVASATTVQNSLIVRDTGHNVIPANLSGEALHARGYAYVVYDGPGRLYNSHLVGYSGPLGTSVFYSEFGAALRHTNHLVSGLTFEPAALPVVVFHDWFVPAFPPLIVDNPPTWGIAIRDLDGSLSGGLSGKTLVANHPMMRLANDVNANGANGRLSAERWGHLRTVQYELDAGGAYVVIPKRSHPAIEYQRGAYASTSPVTYLEGAAADNRQLPAIVRAAGSSGAECVYRLSLQQPGVTPQGAQPVTRRADFIVDDVDVGETTRLVIRQYAAGAWNPGVWVNESGQSTGWTAVPSVASLPATTPVTTYARVAWNPQTPTLLDAIEVRLVNPARRHRITVAW